MRNKKRIRKLIQEKYKASRKRSYWPLFCKLFVSDEYLKMLKNISRFDFEREYMNYPLSVEPVIEYKYIPEIPFVGISDLEKHILIGL